MVEYIVIREHAENSSTIQLLLKLFRLNGQAVAREVENAHRIGRPCLIGTTNVT